MKKIEQITTLADWQSYRSTFPKGSKMGFVPTMGALHPGHLALVEQARSENDFVVASIYVNPTQFNNPADFAAYPLDLENDLRALESVGCDAVFLPEEAAIYPNGPVAHTYDLQGLDQRLEGALRPGHFQGVATVVDRMFDLLQPDAAYFGEKDFQQVKVIQRVAELRGGQPRIVPCPLVREKDGVAMAARTRRLTPLQREFAPQIFEALRFAQEEIAVFPVPIKALVREMRSIIEAGGQLKVEDISFALADSMMPVTDPERYLDRYPEPVQCFVSAYAGEVRLIDTHRVVQIGHSHG
ncbi:MAG: pantoate--beta-alanine ligase [Schleiferiaceae bacterium]